MLSYRLGLDVGTNSLGWSVLELNQDGKPCAVRDAGARIFSDGRVDKSKATLKADRREARLARRRHDRYKQRRTFLLDKLTEAELFPKDKDTKARHKLQTLDPLKLRARALTEKLAPHEIGRALFHLNQRRGFKSNRKDKNKETTSGMVSNSVTALLRAMTLMEEGYSAEALKNLSKEDRKSVREQEGRQRKEALEKLGQQHHRTFGSFLWERRDQGKPTRARPHSDGKLYDVYPTREMLEHEFDTIWMVQAKHHPELLTEKNRKQIRKVIFTQRPLKPQKVGKCMYLPNEDRIFRAMPSFQRYRIYQEVNNLEWTTSRHKNMLTGHPEARNEIVDMLERPKNQKGEVTFGTMKKVLKKRDLAEGNFQFNLETLKRKALDGNLTSNLMQDESRVGPQWHGWTLEEQDDFIDVILNGTPEQQRKYNEEKEKGIKASRDDPQDDDKEVQDYLMRTYNLSDISAERCMDAPLVEYTASLSKQAARLLLVKMRDDMLRQTDAVQEVAKETSNFVNPYKRSGENTLLDYLPYYGEAFQDGRHIILGDRRPEDRDDDFKFYGGVTNPTVHIALNQIRHVVNELIHRYGRPTSIAIELGRELPEGKDYRVGFDNAQAVNQERNRQWNDILRDEDQETTRDNRLLLQLWQEQDECCPYTGRIIGRGELFSGGIDIDHLIPFSLSLDDSRANKVVCTRQANRDKGNQTPWQAFGNSPPGYNWHEIFERSKNIKYEQPWFNRKSKPKPRWETDTKSKLWRFQKDAMETWERDNDFTARHLNDTRYIGRLAREYLECICHIDKIDVLTGRLTALLRGHWGLNSVLYDHNQLKEPKKNREDHRHHAVDAIVIGMTSHSTLQTVSRAANRAETLNLPTIFEKHNSRKSAIDPWDGFRNDVREAIQNIIVSHKSRRKNIRYRETKDGKRIPVSTDGQLHNDTAYGIILAPDDNGQSEVVARKPVSWFENENRLKKIRNPQLRDKFMRAFQSGGKSKVSEFASDLHIRNLRYTETLKVIPIKGKDGKAYKTYKGDSNWGMEIYEDPQGHKKAGKWDGILISRFAANQRDFQPGHTYRPHPAARLVMRLQINDCVEIEENGKKQIMRLLTISDDLAFAEHNEANVDARNRDKENSFTYYYKTANALKSVKARKVHISPTGKVNYEVRRKPHRKL